MLRIAWTQEDTQPGDSTALGCLCFQISIGRTTFDQAIGKPGHLHSMMVLDEADWGLHEVSRLLYSAAEPPQGREGGREPTQTD